MKLHIGGTQTRPGWTLMNIQDGPGVDLVGDLSDLSGFADDSIEEIYASHVLEHIPQQAVAQTLRGAWRVLVGGGLFKIAVPDMEMLCRLMLDPEAPFEAKFLVMRMMFGGQIDRHDYHYFGWTQQFMEHFLRDAGFTRMERVETFGLFEDTSNYRPFGVPISLNVIASK
ncbi:MAG: methyltransferase domain-containing protein [Burkholderiaceae bacterium]|jgi:predicted SAM-dependent methyltransferase